MGIYSSYRMNTVLFSNTIPTWVTAAEGSSGTFPQEAGRFAGISGMTDVEIVARLHWKTVQASLQFSRLPV